jgi:hypothetical protein
MWKPKFDVRKLREENSRLTVALARAKEQLEIGRRLQTGMRIALSLRSNGSLN